MHGGSLNACNMSAAATPSLPTSADYANLAREVHSLETPIRLLDTHLRDMTDCVDEVSRARLKRTSALELAFNADNGGLFAGEPDLLEAAETCDEAWHQFEAAHSKLARSVAQFQGQWNKRKKPRLTVLAYVKAKEKAAELCFKTRKFERERRDRIHKASRDLKLKRNQPAPPVTARNEEMAAPVKDASVQPNRARLDFFEEDAMAGDDQPLHWRQFELAAPDSQAPTK